MDSALNALYTGIIMHYFNYNTIFNNNPATLHKRETSMTKVDLDTYNWYICISLGWIPTYEGFPLMGYFLNSCLNIT